MNPVELRELMKDAEVRGQYLASIRHRGKDVLLGDIEKLIEIMIDEAVEIEERKTENAILNQQLSAKTISEQNIINAFGISGEGAHSKLVIEYVHGLVAENEELKQAIPKPKEIDFHDDRLDDVSVAEQVGFNQAISKITKSMHETPNTDAFTAELRAQGVDEYALAFRENTNMDFACNRGFYHGALDFAANLRAGRKG